MLEPSSPAVSCPARQSLGMSLRGFLQNAERRGPPILLPPLDLQN